MPGGKRKLKQLFVGRIQSGADGTEITKIMTGSVSFATSGQVQAAAETATCYISEVTIANLTSCAIMLGTVEGLSGSLEYDGIIAGDGQASIVLRLRSASTVSGSVDARASGQTLRYISFDTV